MFIALIIVIYTSMSKNEIEENILTVVCVCVCVCVYVKALIYAGEVCVKVIYSHSAHSYVVVFALEGERQVENMK